MVQDASTLYSELNSTGVIHIGQRRRDEDVDGTWAFQQTERWTLQLGGTYSSSDYHGAGTSALSNFRQACGTASESFATPSSSSSRSTDLRVTRTRPAPSNRPLREPGRRIPVASDGARQRSRQRRRQPADHRDSPSNTIIGALSASYSTELSKFALTAQRQMQPSGFGIFTQVDQATLTATRDLSERCHSPRKPRYTGTPARSVAFISFTYAERTYAESHLRLNWQQTPTWTLAQQLQYDRADNPGASSFPPDCRLTAGWSACSPCGRRSARTSLARST